MREFFKKDIVLKVISVLIAIIIWFFVMDSSSNPLETTTFTVPIKTKNENMLNEKNIGIKNSNYPQEVLLSVRGRRNKLIGLNPNNFEIVLDFAQVQTIDDSVIPLNVPTSDVKGISIVEINPNSVELDIENIIKKSFPVEVQYEGTPKRKYEVISHIVEPEKIQVRGFESVVNSVNKVIVLVDINGLDRDTTIRKDYKIFDKDGNEINDLTSNTSVDVRVEFAKEISLTTYVTGNPHQDYVFKKISVNPDKVLVKGPPEELDNLNEIKIEPFNIQNAKENKSEEIPITLPENITLASEEKEVEISVEIEKLVTKELIFSKSEISLENMNQEFNYKNNTDRLVVLVKGKKNDISLLNKTKVALIVDVEGYNPGMYNLPVKFNLSEKYQVVSPYYVEIEVEKPEPTPEPTSEPENTSDQ